MKMRTRGADIKGLLRMTEVGKVWEKSGSDGHCREYDPQRRAWKSSRGEEGV